MKCPDCPDLIVDPVAEGIVPRARCCNEAHIDRRLDGSFEPFPGNEKARELADTEDAHRTRQQRRYEQRKGKQ